MSRKPRVTVTKAVEAPVDVEMTISFNEKPKELNMERVPCDVCGVTYSARGMSTHKKGLRCRVDSAIKRHRDVGLEPISFRQRGVDSRDILPELESLMKKGTVRSAKDLAVYVQGDHSKSSETKMGIFVEPEVGEFVKLMYSWAVEILPFAFKYRLMGFAHDPEFRKAFNALSSILQKDVDAAVRDDVFPVKHRDRHAVESSASKAFVDLVERWSRE